MLLSHLYVLLSLIFPPLCETSRQNSENLFPWKNLRSSALPLLWRISLWRFLAVKWCRCNSQIILNPTFERYFVTVWNIWPPPRRVFQTNPQNVCATVAMEHPKWSEIRYIFSMKYSTSLSDNFRKRLHHHCFNFYAEKDEADFPAVFFVICQLSRAIN